MRSPPMGLVNQSTPGNAMGGHATRQEDAKSPGSDGVSPYLPSIVLVLIVGSGALYGFKYARRSRLENRQNRLRPYASYL
jgi:hypothetical protein